MKTPVIGPFGPSFLSLVILSGCSGKLNNAEVVVPEPLISVTVAATAPLPNVQKLSLEFSPSHIYAPCQPNDTPVSAADCYPTNIRVFTDGEGLNRVVEPLIDCREEIVRVPPPAYDPDNPDAYQQWVEAGGEYQRSQVCSGGGASTSDLTLINALETNPLPISYIARDFDFVEGTFSRIIVQAWGLPNRDDSYVDLIDGRRCEVKVIFPNDIARDGHHYANFTMPAFTILKGEVWRIDLTLDFSGTVIDPARCADGIDLYVTPGSASARLVEQE